MPLQKLDFRPGINREGTSLANEGGWFDCDKIRFRSGFPEKIGGWAALSYNKFLGVCRSLWNWVTLNGANLLGIGTNLKFYVEYGGAYYDITPVRLTTTGTTTFATTSGSRTVTVTDTGASGLSEGDFVTFSGASTVGGLDLNGEYQITTLVSGTVYRITAASNATSTVSGGGGAAVVSAYQISTGQAVASVGTGWGAGTWSRSTWGSGVSSSGTALQLRLWSQANFGDFLLFAPRGGSLYLWQPGTGASPAVTTRGTAVTGVDVPAFVSQVMVSDATRIVICFGCNDLGAYGSTPFDPLLIRWSDQESYTDWSPNITNQAGSYRLSRGSAIIGALQTRQEILVWTDAAVYSMQYQGPPYVYGFTLLADNITVASMNAMTTVSGVTYWMGTDKFYVYAGRVETLPCTVRQFVFEDINLSQSAQIFSGSNEAYNEIWWFYCSANSNTVDRYVIFNHLDRVWYYGTMNRTAWLDTPTRQYPVAATGDSILVYHEAAVDDGTTNPPSPINAYIQSSDFDIGDGHNYGFVWRMLPDITFDGSDATYAPSSKPYVNFTVRPKQNPGSPYGIGGSPTVKSAQSYAGQSVYTVQEFTEIIYARVRGRQLAFKVSSDSLGTQWQLGSPRLDVRPDGRR